MNKIITFLFLFSVCISHAQNSTTDTINTIVTSQITSKDPSLFVGVVKDGAILYSHYNGLASLQHQVPVTETSRSNIASVAKQFTALCILQLQLNGALSLEDDIRTHLPNLFPGIKEPIRIRHLINHTSGIRDYSDLMSMQREPWWSRVGLDNEDVMRLLEKQEELNFTPGSEYIYSNSNYTVLTKIVEKVSGTSFHDYSKKLFETLGMKNTAFLKNYMAVMPNQVLPYSDWGDGVWQQYPMVTNLYGDGFLFTTLQDQLIFEQAIQNAKKTNNQLLIQSQLPIPNSEITTYGFGLELTHRLNYKAVHHSGGTGSYHAQTVRYPEEGLSIFVMSSNSTLWSGGIADQIAKIILPNKESNEGITEVDISTLSLGKEIMQKELFGNYKTLKESTVRLYEKDGAVYYQRDTNNPYKLIKEKTNLYAFEAFTPAKIGFSQIEGQPIGFTLYQPDEQPRAHTKLPDVVLDTYQLKAYTGVYKNTALDVSFEIFKKENTLRIRQKDQKGSQEVILLTPTDLLFSDYKITVQKDAFNRISDLLVSVNRLKNIRFVKKTSLEFQPQITTDTGSIQVTTIGSKGKGSTILLTKNDTSGNEIWFKQYGGKSYDKANSIINTKDGGYLLIGATSSFGNGNYDVYTIKVDAKGKEQWSTTYGSFYNEYGYIAEETDNGYRIKGTKQACKSNNMALDNNCTTNVWMITIDKKGNKLSDIVQEEIKDDDDQQVWNK